MNCEYWISFFGNLSFNDKNTFVFTYFDNESTIQNHRRLKHVFFIFIFFFLIDCKTFVVQNYLIRYDLIYLNLPSPHISRRPLTNLIYDYLSLSQSLLCVWCELCWNDIRVFSSRLTGCARRGCDKFYLVWQKPSNEINIIAGAVRREFDSALKHVHKIHAVGLYTFLFGVP